MKSSLKTSAMAAVVMGAVLLGAGVAQAGQVERIDTRWVPWLGCWQLWEEQLDGTEPSDTTDINALVERTSVCVTPTETGVELTAAVGDQILVERRLVADGQPHDIVEEECRGWERNEWSRDGHRLFTTGELQCGSDAPRRLSGVSIMSSPSSWVDIQFVEMGEHRQLEVRRYSPMPSSADATGRDQGALLVDSSQIRQARRESAEDLILSDVMEAGAMTAPRVVEALLVETEPDLGLDSKSLIALDEAGIDHQVIDLMVALSYPEQFVVERRDRSGTWSSTGRGYGGFGGFYDPIWYSDLYPYYVTPFGSRYWGGGYNPYLYGGAVASPFIVIPGGGVPTDGVQQATGRAVRGRGYTRVVPRASEPRQGGIRSGQTSSGSSGGSTARTGSSGSSGRSGGSRGGFSGGGTSTGRRAVPRN